jgi:hypothetical protein
MTINHETPATLPPDVWLRMVETIDEAEKVSADNKNSQIHYVSSNVKYFVEVKNETDI